jgi:hypothetical protein
VLASPRGRLGPVARKNGWRSAAQAGEAPPGGMQRLLAAAAWDAAAVRGGLCACVAEHPGDAGAVLAVAATGVRKKGTQSAGGQRQSSGPAGRIKHCRVGVLPAAAARDGRAVPDREWSLPQGGAEDAARREEAGVPGAGALRTKPRLAAGATGDEVDGGDRRWRLRLEAQGAPRALAVKRTGPLVAVTGGGLGVGPVPAPARVAALPAAAWTTGRGARSGRGPVPTGLAHDVCYGPAAPPPADPVRVAGARWAVAAVIEAAKGGVDLDRREGRRWGSWHRRVTLCLLAHAFLAVTRARAAGTERGGCRRPPTCSRRPCPRCAGSCPVWFGAGRRRQARARRCRYRRRLPRLREHLRP